MIHYKDFSQGYLTYHCDYCDKIVNTRLSCNSRFCPSCGNRYRDERALSISKKVIAKPHRQFVFSMAYPLTKIGMHYLTFYFKPLNLLLNQLFKNLR